MSNAQGWRARTPILALVGLLAVAGVWSGNKTAHADPGQKVNPDLLAFNERFKPELVKTSDRIHAAFGYDYANYGYVEGDDGIIVVDAGWFPGQAKRSIEDYRKMTGKPVAAVVYTHLHIDHYGGLRSILEGQSTDIPIYGPFGWKKWVDESFNAMRPALFRRIFMQMGVVLPAGEDGSVGASVGPTPKTEGTPELYAPNVDVAETLEVEISGVRIQLIPMYGDLNENLLVWFPDDKVLFTGDTIAGTFPAVETVRFEAERDPKNFVTAFNKMLELEPDYIVPGHGRILKGAEDVQDVVSANRDATQFLIDQIDRYYIKGYSADQVVDSLKLPPKLAAHPDLALHYHRLEWMIKTMHMKRAGFVGDAMDYVTLTESEEAKRLVPLLGGAEAVLVQAETALQNGDARWAARLATFALEVDGADQRAKETRQQAFRMIAQTTLSSNERNYMLSIVKEENGELDWKKMFGPGDYEVVKDLDADALFDLMRVRFRAEAANDIAMSLAVTLSDTNMTRYFVVRNNILFISDKKPDTLDAELSMTRDTLNRIAAHLTDWSAALQAKAIEVATGAETARTFVGLIE